MSARATPESTSKKDKKKPIYALRILLCHSKDYDKWVMIDPGQSASARIARDELYRGAQSR